MWIEKHKISNLVDANYLFEYMTDLQINLNEYEEYKLMLVEDIQSKDELPDFQESVRKVLNALVAHISDLKKQEKVQKFIQNKI